MLRGIIDIRARRISDHHQCLMLVTTLGTTAVAPGTITKPHIPSAVPQRLLISCSLQISLLASNSNTYTLHRYLPQLLINNHIVLVYFRPPAPLPIPTFHSRHPTTIDLAWAISVEPHRGHGLIVERNCGVLWGRREPLRLLEG